LLPGFFDMPTMFEWSFRNALKRLAIDVRCPTCGKILMRPGRVVAGHSLVQVAGHWFCSFEHARAFTSRAARRKQRKVLKK
jgi:hypothetical protein